MQWVDVVPCCANEQYLPETRWRNGWKTRSRKIRTSSRCDPARNRRIMFFRIWTCLCPEVSFPDLACILPYSNLTTTASVLKMVCFYTAQYPVRWTTQSALYFTPDRPVHSVTNLASLGSILDTQQLREDYSITYTAVYTQVLLYKAQ